MYYEEKFENGQWYRRGTPNGDWEPFDKRMLERLEKLEAENAAFRKYLFDLQWMPEDYTDDGERQSQAVKPYVDFNRHEAAELIAACDARFKGAKERHKARAEKLEAVAEAAKAWSNVGPYAEDALLAALEALNT